MLDKYHERTGPLLEAEVVHGLTVTFNMSYSYHYSGPLYSWELLSGVAAIWSLSVCTTLIWGLYIGATCASRRNDYDHSKGRLHPDFGVSKTSSFALCFQLLVAYMCTCLYWRTCHEGKSTPADTAESHLYVWTIGVFVWINAVGFVRLFRHI